MRPWIWIGVSIAVLGAGAVIAAVTGLADTAARYEEPPYEVVRKHPSFEVRGYGPTVEARVTVAGTYEESVQAAFRILAGYIFGGNKPGISIAMTTPVSSSPVGERIAMTTPVSAVPGAQGWRVSFTMPANKTLATLPTPNDPRVELVEVPGGTWAVRTFRGRASDRAVASELEALRRDAEGAGVRLDPGSVVSQFNPPWVLGPWRKNEVRCLVN